MQPLRVQGKSAANMKFCLLVIFGCVVAGLQQNATENDPDNTTSDTTTVAGL